MATWVQQRCLGFDSFVDSITCIHFAALPDEHNNNRRREALYVGCNNGLVLIADVSALAETQQQESSSLRTDVSPVLSLLYRHGNQQPQQQQQQQPLGVEDESRNVFSIFRYESLLATCGDDGRCIITMTDSHHHRQPPHRLDKLQSLPPGCCQLDPAGVVGVIDLSHKTPIRAVSVFGGRRSWQHDEGEDSAAYVALGCEDGLVRVFRIDVGMAMATIERAAGDGSFSQWADFSSALQRSCNAVWVVNTSVPAAALSAHGGENDESGDSRGGTAVCSLVFDEVDELFVVGTQTGCCLCECLPPVSGRSGAPADDAAATVDSWLNASVWALSSGRLVVPQKKDDDSLVQIPLRAMKPKYLEVFHSSRSIGFVTGVQEGSNLLVMFPSLGNKQLTLPQKALRKVQMPTVFLATSGGPFFSVQPLSSSGNNSSPALRKHYLIAGAAVSGEVCLVAVSDNEREISVLCRFSAGRDLIKNISIAPSSSSSSSSSSVSNLFVLVMCSSYDGTISDWVLAFDKTKSEGGVSAVRRGVTFVSSAASSAQQVETEESQRLVESRSRFPHLLRGLEIDPRTHRYVPKSDDHHDEQKTKEVALPEDYETARSTGVAATFLFPEAGVLFASCLFERAVQSFLLVRRQGCEPPSGFFFNGRRTVRVELNEARSVAEVPEFDLQ